MQNEITENQNIFEQDGTVMCAGWAKNPVFIYNKELSKSRKKHCEQNCYYISSDEVALYLSLEKMTGKFYIKLAVADLKKGGTISDSTSKKLFFKKLFLPDLDFSGKFEFSDDRIQLQIANYNDNINIKCRFAEFGGQKKLEFAIKLSKLYGETLNELAPFERNRRYFYYKQFMPSYLASGFISVGSLKYTLSESNSRAYLDLTRFAKPRKHSYQRLSADCIIDGKRFSLCFASRVGDNRYGNENCFIINGKITKLSQINVKSTNGRLDRPWYFKGGISAVDISFTPFTVKGEPMTANIDNTTVLFGRLLGTIQHTDYDEPITLDNATAHMVLSEF